MSIENDPTHQEVSIRFPGISGSKANASAASLRETLRNINPTVVVGRDKDNPNTQDMGAVLTVVLGSAPVAAIAAGVASWIKIHRVKVQIRTAEQSVDVSGDGADAARIIEAVFKKK
jgi:hypothetical protein